MGHSSRGRFRQQASFLLRQFLQEGDLPFNDVLSEESLSPNRQRLSPGRQVHRSSHLATLGMSDNGICPNEGSYGLFPLTLLSIPKSSNSRVL